MAPIVIPQLARCLFFLGLSLFALGGLLLVSNAFPLRQFTCHSRLVTNERTEGKTVTSNLSRQGVVDVADGTLLPMRLIEFARKLLGRRD
jgi:hypothetical protein